MPRRACRPSPRSARRCSRGGDETGRSTPCPAGNIAPEESDSRGDAKTRRSRGDPTWSCVAATSLDFDRWTPCQAVARGGGHIATIGLRPIAPGSPLHSPDDPSMRGQVQRQNTKFKAIVFRVIAAPAIPGVPASPSATRGGNLQVWASTDTRCQRPSRCLRCTNWNIIRTQRQSVNRIPPSSGLGHPV